MRQRRQRLQVSTFPFLAVLLCAMGSLILFLLVIDRRAKIVARVKAIRAMEQTWSQATAEDEPAAAADRAEWERRRRLLHEQLMQEDQQIRAEFLGIESKTAAAAAQVEAELASSHQLQEQLQNKRSRLARYEDELSARRMEAAKTARQADVSQADLARLTAELKRLERALADVKALRQRQQQMYSLVPYRGKRGDSRRPLYLECTGADLIFHPDHLTLHGWALTSGGIRAEIERRLARQRAETKVAGGKPEENAYLLMLIRPNGIGTYYHTLAALKGLPFDFGYEFIEQDWILDFSEDGNTPKKQPWMAVEEIRGNQPTGSFITKGQPLGPSTGRSQTLAGPSGSWDSSINGKGRGGQPGLPALAGASGWSEGSSAVSASQVSRPGEPGGVNASGSERGHVGAPSLRGENATPLTTRGANRTPLANPGANATALGETRSGRAGNGMSPPNGEGGQQGLPSAGTTPGRPMGILATGTGLPDNSSVAMSDGTGAPFAKNPAGGMNSSLGTAASLDGNLATAQIRVAGQADPPFAPGTMAERTSSGSVPANGQSDRSGEAPSAGSPGTVGKTGIEAAPTPLPSFAPNGANGAGSPGHSAPGAPSSPGSDGIPAQGRPDSEEPLHGPPGNPLEHLAAQSRQRKPALNIPPRPGPLVGNRDWIIPIECTADALVLPSSGQRITIAELSRGDTRRNALLQSVQRMIARRQATVRPGEPPYRPMIRFRVWPDGLRSYYLAYPALEALQVPMTRENLDPEEKKAASRQR
jgi:hypothetical protein